LEAVRAKTSPGLVEEVGSERKMLSQKSAEVDLMKDFIEKVAGENNEKKCPCCDKVEWATLPLAGKLPVGEGDQSLGVAVKVCTACHFSRFFVQFSK
jgi:hypothetical protein